ncbi:hypothetical protein CgunFtcFv8_010417 [Champsocephalus gunnari]|uniref:Tumor protein p53-inducible protein 13 n=1 Tax=Champsocephalus gunnari TaxID=52237 RepID=A0AAN8DUV2_CHAGU|nr:hypothetical protein CgunFtcFv8_010417 [Champsocephalus gunnari]
MPSRTTSPPLTATLLAALWLSLGRCGVLGPPGCDNGKLSLGMDLPEDAVHWDCPGTIWPESTQRLPSIDRVYDPEPAMEICMDKPISYNHTFPNSGAYRPVRAESGEYLYCPPQRWLNNLHHGATVLLYHPCCPLRERLLLSVLARSCLPDYIMTSHPQLNTHRPIALVSWGHTLELSTAASSDICDWLETTATTRNTFGGVSQSRKYNLLLTRSAEQHRQQHAGEHSAKMMKQSLKQCCEQTLSSQLSGAMETQLESSMKKEGLELSKEEGKSRQMRAIKEKQGDVEDENKRGNATQYNINRTSISRTGDVHNYNNTLGPSTGNTEASSQSEIQNTNHGLTPSPFVGSNMSETRLRSDSLGLMALESQDSSLTLQTAAQQSSNLRNPNPSAGSIVLANGANSEQNSTARPEAQAISSTNEGSAKHRDSNSLKHSLNQKKMGRDDTMKDNEAIDVKERELEHKRSHSHHKSEKIGFDSVSKSESPPLQPQHNQNPQTVSYLPNDCDSCKAGEHCECSEGSGAAAVNPGLPRTPRTDEALWAAAALGFLLILLTLSVLHTRLCRQWRTTPSLYWHDPQRDYDSVADVIRTRIRIANRRRKRGRRQECVLLPSSSSSDEHP